MVESLILSSRNSLPTNIQFKILDHLFEKFNQIEDKYKVECTKKIEEVIECFIKKSSCFVVPNHGIVSVQSNQDIPVEVNKKYFYSDEFLNTIKKEPINGMYYFGRSH